MFELKWRLPVVNMSKVGGTISSKTKPHYYEYSLKFGFTVRKKR